MHHTDSSLDADSGTSTTNPALQFFEALWPTFPGDAWIYLSVPQSNGMLRQHWFGSLEAAADAATEIGEIDNCYFGVALAPKPYGEFHRVCLEKRKDAKGVSKYRPPHAVPGLWMDVDYGTQGHKKKNLPPTLPDALDLLKSCGLEPTVIVHSGNGLHAYWCFSEPWILDTEEDLDKAATLLRDWGCTFTELARRRGWEVDATSDLPRILRVPGTWNRKEGADPIEVRLLRDDGPRHDQEAFASRMVARSPVRIELPQGEVNAEGLVLNTEAQPPLEKYCELRERSRKFKQTADRQRPDISDSSPSGHEMGIANILVKEGWSDQEIVDTLIYLRAKHGESADELKKALRIDYWVRTLGKARAGSASPAVAQVIDELVHQQAVPDSGGDSASASRELLRKLLGFPIKRILCYCVGEDVLDQSYILETDGGGQYRMGKVDVITSRLLFDKWLGAAVRKALPPLKKNEWSAVKQALLDIVEMVGSIKDGGEMDQTRQWLQSYLHRYPPSPFNLKDFEFTAGSQRSYVKDDGKVRIFLARLTTHVQTFHNFQIESRNLGRRLREIGAEPYRENYTKASRGDTSTSVFILPDLD